MRTFMIIEHCDHISLQAMFNDPDRRNNEKTFVEMLYFSPLRRAGTHIDLILRRIGLCIQKVLCFWVESVRVSAAVAVAVAVSVSLSMAAEDRRRRTVRRFTWTSLWAKRPRSSRRPVRYAPFIFSKKILFTFMQAAARRKRRKPKKKPVPQKKHEDKYCFCLLYVAFFLCERIYL
jgi:hypothetical protein